MTPLELQNALKKRVEEATNMLLLGSAEGQQKVLQVFEQHLPTKQKSQSRNPESTFYPCVIVYLDEGDHPGGEDPDKVKVYFVIGIYDDESDNQGYKDAMNVKEKIIQNLIRNPFIEGRFEFQKGYKWKYDDESNAPYYFVWIEAFFSIPRMEREDVEAMI